MADSDFRVKAIIEANTSNFDKGMKQAQASAANLSNTFGNLSKIITKALSFAGLTIGTKAIVDFGKSCVQSATQAQKAFNILDNTIRVTGADAWTSTKELENASKALSDSTNYSVTEIQKMQSVLLGFTNITGEAFNGASEAVLDMATVMGMDLTSAVQTVGKALDDPITGLDSLRRQGFKFTDEQKAELAQLVKTGKQLEAQKIILDTLAISYGGASKAGQDSFAKQRHAVENFSDTLGGKLIPLMKSFAMDNANMIDSLREYLNEIDFNQIGATIKITFDGIKKGIQNSFEYVKKIFSETKSFMKNIDFKPIISIIDNLVGAFEKIEKINLSRVTNIIKDLKDSFSGFSENIDLTKFSEVINLIINGFVFLYEEVNKVFDTLLDNIKTFIINTWNSIKSIFEAGNKALADSETDIKSWGDYFYTIFNNLFKTVQDVIQSISYLLSGDWEIAWQYAKLVVLRIVDSVIDSMTTLITAFKDKIISILNFAQMLSPFLGTSGKVIKTALSGIEALVDGVDKNSKKIKDTMTELVENTENKIEELTGKPADKNIEDLQKFTSGSKNALGEFIDNFKEATDKAKKELDNLSGEYKATTNSMNDNSKSTYEAFSEWDSKLLKQRQNNLSEYSKEYHEINIQLIEQERKKALENKKNEKERAKINEYYDKEIEEENERFEEAKRNKAKETMKIIISTLSNIARNTVEVFKKVVSTIKNVFSAIGNFVKNTFSAIKNIFSELFDFNVDDALNSLLAVEDAILTFFVETLPKLPNFFESAFSSVLILIQTLINSIDWEKVKTILGSIIKTFITYAPQILSGIVELFSGLVATISSVLVEDAPEIVSAIGEMFFTILEALPGLISNFLKLVGTYLSEIGKYITDNEERLTKDLTDIVSSIVEGISNFIESGGWKNLLSAILTIQKAIENAVSENLPAIVDTIIEALPDLVQFLIDSIVSASKTLSKVIKPILKLIIKLIEAIVNVMFSDEVLDASMEVVEALFEALTEVAIEVMPKVLPKLIAKLIKVAIRTLASFPIEIAKAFINGIRKAFGNTDWGQFVKDLFTGFIDGIKELFGIHSPSTLFEEFGEYMIEGLWNGIKNFGGWLWDNIKNLFTNIIDGISDIFSSIGGKVSGAGSGIKNAFGNVKDFFSGLGEDIKNAFNGIGEKFKSVFSTASDNMKSAFYGVGDWFKSVFSTVSTNVSNAFSNFGNIAKSAWSNIKSGFGDVGDWFKTTFSKAVTNIKSAFSGLSTWFSSLTTVINNIFSNCATKMKNVMKSAGDYIKSLAEDIVDGLSSVGGNIKDAVSSAGSKIKSFFGFANGTQSAPRGLALVGEAGPELVRFRGGEQVLNAHNTQKALEGMGGNTNNFNVTFNNLQDTSAFTMIQQLKQYNRQMAINGVI